MITMGKYEKRCKPKCLDLIVQFFNHHADRMGRERWIDLSQAETILDEWLEDGLLFVCEDTGFDSSSLSEGLSAPPDGSPDQGSERVLVGLVRLREDHGTYWIDDIMVDEERRHRGIGSEILKEVENWVLSKGATSLFLDVVPSNLGALDFFMGNGYVYLNTIELCKDLQHSNGSSALSTDGSDSKEAKTPKTTEVTFLGRHFLVRGEIELREEKNGHKV